MKHLFFGFLISIPFVLFQIAFDFSNCAIYRSHKGKTLFFAIVTWILFLFGIWFAFYLFAEWPLWARILSCFCAYGFGRAIYKLVFQSINQRIKNDR
jgi:Sec-independent protein secretion pathway component TatC